VAGNEVTMRGSYRHALAVLAGSIPFVLLTAIGETGAEPGGASTLRVRVTGVRSDAGSVRIQLFDGPEGYPTKPGKALQRRSTRITKGEALVVFEGLAEGTYALFAFHDEDGDGKVRSNFVGMPTEGVGASNNAKGRMGPPSFKAASIRVAGEETVVAFSLRYL
jgi:uncharacterized protein (DUF2141 family)